MYEIVIASHGPMAEGMKKSVGMFSDKTDHIHTICLDEQGIDAFEKSVAALIQVIRNEHATVAQVADNLKHTIQAVSLREQLAANGRSDDE